LDIVNPNMAKGYTDSSGKFHPMNDSESSSVSSDQVKDDAQPEMNSDDVKKLKNRKQD